MPLNPADAITDAMGALAADPFAVGQVTATAAATVTVTVRGASKTLSKLAAYSAPAVGDVVLIACAPGAWCALGRIG